MKILIKYYKKCQFLLLLFISLIGYSQFNTLKPINEKKTEEKIFKTNEQENLEKITPKEIQKKKKKSLKELLNITTKSDLKNEIDSLKNLIKVMGTKESSTPKNELKKIKDSLLSLLQKETQIQNNKVRDTQKIDLNNEYKFSKISMPLKEELSVSSPFGTRIHPIFGNVKMHNGVDLKANYVLVYSVLDGIVTEAGWDENGGGNYIKVLHSNRFETSYLHLSEIYYKVGEKVKAGYIIAKSGNSGNSTGAHLHFAVKEFGRYFNPIQFLNDLKKANNLINTYYDNTKFANR